MTQSMTGFASKVVEISISATEKLSLSLHLKALNSRYFETTCKLPYLLNHCEVSIHRILKKKLERGHIYLVVKVQQDPTKHVAIPAKKTIEQYLTAIHEIQKMCNITEPVSLSTILSLPNVFQVEENMLEGSVEDKILQAIESLADDLILTRESEGIVLAKDVILHIKSMMKKLQDVGKKSLKVSKEKKELLSEVLEKLQQDLEAVISVERCALEASKNVLLLELEKIDIHEEIVRATSHAKNILLLISNKELSKGKKLDFTLQELNREINTIASKCSDSAISALTIEMKSDIEKAREQVQNIL